MASGVTSVFGGKYSYNGNTYGSEADATAAQKADSVAVPYSEGAPSAGQAKGANTTAAGAAAQTGANYQVDPYGMTSYDNAAEQGRVSDKLHAQLQADAEARRLAAISSMSGGGGSAPQVGNGNVPFDENAARAAAFARAKDQAGQIARSSLTSVQENATGRGIVGSGIEGLRAAGKIMSADAPLQDLTREQYIADNNRASNISDETYAGNIQQRGQTLQSEAAKRSSLMALYSSAYGGAY